VGLRIPGIAEVTGYNPGISLWNPDKVSVVNTKIRKVVPLYEIPVWIGVILSVMFFSGKVPVRHIFG
jgi:hypothetical protein